MKAASRIIALGLGLALAACGGEAAPSKDTSKGGAVPLGFELAASSTAQIGGASVRELAPDDVARELARGSIRLIDIRTAAELAEDAPIAGAEHIPMDALDPAVLDKTDGREAVLYCRSGRRSEMAAQKLAEQAGKPVTHMPGGILAWQERVRLAAACDKSGGQGC